MSIRKSYPLYRRLLAVLVALALVIALSPQPESAYAVTGETKVVTTAAPYSMTTPTESFQSIMIGPGAVASLTAPAAGQLLTLTVDGVERKIADGTTYSSSDPNGVVLTATDKFSTGKFGSQDGQGRTQPEDYRAALFIDNGVVDTAKSVQSAVSGSGISTNLIDGIQIKAGAHSLLNPASPQFSGLVLNSSNGAIYDVKNTDIDLLSDADGHPDQTNDFVGLGSAVSLFNGANAAFDNVNIHTTGVAKPALYTDSSTMLFKNSSYNVEGGTVYSGYVNSAFMDTMVAPPWVLGIAGNSRGSNLVGDDTVNVFLDSSMKAKGWGVVSSDSGQNGVITTVNSDITMTGDTGYGIYAIGNVLETFFGTKFDVATYAMIVTGGTGKFTSLTQGQQVDIPASAGAITSNLAYSKLTSSYTGAEKPTTVDSQFGIMAHGDADLTIEKKTAFDTYNAALLLKSGMSKISVDNSTLNAKDGVIMQLMDNDDSTVGTDPLAMGPLFNTSFFEKAGWPDAVTKAERDAAPAPPGPPGAPAGGGSAGADATFTNVSLTGDFYNASGYKYISGSANAASSYASPKTMNITLGAGATLNGVISLSRSMHVWMDWVADNNDTQGGHYAYRTAKKNAAGEGSVYQDAKGNNYVQATGFTIDNYYNLGHVINQTGSYAEGATADVALKSNAVWTLSGDSYLTKLTIADTAKIAAPAGKNIVVKVDGAAKTTAAAISAADIPAAGYAGKIQLSLSDIPKKEIKTVSISAITTRVYTGKQFKPAMKLSDGGKALTKNKNFTVSYGTNKNIGKGTVKITGKGDYTGTVTKTFKIVPKKTSITKIAAGKKKLKAFWKKVSAVQKVTGYQVQYRVKGTSKWKTKTVSAKKAAALTITKLKKNKLYQVRVRAYKTVSGTKYYAAWSTAKTSNKIK